MLLVQDVNIHTVEGEHEAPGAQLLVDRLVQKVVDRPVVGAAHPLSCVHHYTAFTELFQSYPWSGHHGRVADGSLDDERLLKPALDAFNALTDRQLSADAEGIWHLGGICSVAGLGPDTNRRRDGSVAYYLSEPVVADDAKGVGPYFMALSEALKA